MNPETIVFLELSKSVVGGVPAHTDTRFSFALGESDMVGFALGVTAAIVVPWLWRKLAKRPTPWASRRTVKILDIAEDDSRHSNSGDDWQTVPRLQLADVSSLFESAYYSTGKSYHCGD